MAAASRRQKQQPPELRSRRRAGQAALLLALVLLTYSNSLSGGFEGDSGPLVTQDPRVQQASRANLGLVFSQQYWYPTADSGLYRPLVTLSWMFNYVVLGNQDRAGGYHAINLALHAANVLLAWLLVLEIWKIRSAAFFTAAIFALHPVNSEAVTNVAGRADLMAALGHELDPAGCAAASLSTATPNRDCPIVATHICVAHSRLVALLAETGRAEDAERHRTSTLRNYGC